MKKEKQLSEHERIRNIEEQLKDIPASPDVAAIVDYKINEFVRLGGIASLDTALISTPLIQSLPSSALSALIAAILTFKNFLSELDKIREKIQTILDTIQPPDPGIHGMPVPQPVPPTPGTQKMRQALEVIAAAKEAAQNAEPESAKDSLKEAKDLLSHEDVRVEFRRLRQVTSWYDILEELQAAIDYLERICK